MTPTFQENVSLIIEINETNISRKCFINNQFSD